MNQSLFQFEQAVANVELDALHKSLQAKLAAKAQRAIVKRQAELDKLHRCVVREHERKP